MLLTYSLAFLSLSFAFDLSLSFRGEVFAARGELCPDDTEVVGSGKVASVCARGKASPVAA